MSTLYLVATPIGNLDDLSPRAVEVLSSVAQIACEDTRTSGVLLQRYGISTPTFAFHQHNEHQKLAHLLNLLDANREVALISDAGMPGISDPGFLPAREAWKAGHTVSAIPGPDAATTALVASGLPCDRYVYEGFLPAKKGRQKQLRQLTEEERTVVLYESPRRLLKLLEELETYMGGERMVAVARELTKKFEEVVRGPLHRIASDFTARNEIRGEITVIIAPKDYRE
ncbi:MAG: 16S rRNA (cytidine(1402)-2'-O)-methyltransferase [Balneolaceae bacterium]|nr:16S rRNA (cytidine(1402)-2'-O)-methyltransferase [Balneolaceae bacterium]